MSQRCDWWDRDGSTDLAPSRNGGPRRGSVLIFVVGLLMLMAIVATAFLASSRADRTAVARHQVNTQADLLLDAVRGMVVQSLSAKADPGADGYLPIAPLQSTDASPALTGTVAEFHSDVDAPAWDRVLADRYPAGVVPATGAAATAARWSYVSGSPLVGQARGGSADLTTDQFASPLYTAANPQRYSTRRHMEATSVRVRRDASRLYPAFKITDTADTKNVGAVVMAADADGDGIADAGLFPLTVGPVGGISYYGAVRVIDNAAAVNVSTAWENWRAAGDEDYRLQGNFTPANVELVRLLEGPAYTDGPDPGRFAAFQTERQGGLATASLTPVRDDKATPYFQWATRFDAFYFGAGQRLTRPGSNGPARYAGLNFAEATDLAYRFTLTPPQSRSAFGRCFPNATGYGPTTRPAAAAVNRLPYAPDQAADWFNKIFNTDALAPAARPIRPYVVAHNPVSNAAPAFLNAPDGPVTATAATDVPAGLTSDEVQRNGHWRYRGAWNGDKLYHINEWVRYGGKAYVATANHTGQTPGTDAAAPFWAEAPWTTRPVKLNPNTASFGLLMAAYWGVMADGPMVKPLGTPDPEYGGTAVWTFGDVVRPGHGSVPLPPYYVKQLRAALAAVNTIDLRDQDNDVTSRTITMRDVNGANPVTAQVYGTERQPYLTEAEVHITKEDEPYVALELHNPYPVLLKLDDLHLAYRDRSTNGPPIEIDAAPAFTGKSIPAYGFLVMESDPLSRPMNTPGKYPTTGVVAVSGLQALARGNDRELLVLRTRRYDGVPIFGSNHPADTFTERTAASLNLPDLVPVDGLEFFGINAGQSNRMVDPTDATQTVAIADRYHYRRATEDGAGRRRWQCVYAGPYDRSAAGDTRRMRGLVRDRRPQVDPDTGVFDPADETYLTAPGFGAKDPDYATPTHNDYSRNVVPDFFPASVPTATYRVRNLELATPGTAGPWGGIVAEDAAFKQPVTPAYATLADGSSASAFPFGGFARTGDLLAVPFVGSYRIEGSGFAEMNPVTLDAAFAEDGDAADDTDVDGQSPFEQLGRFCPLYRATGGTVTYNDFWGRPNPGAPGKPVGVPTGFTADDTAPAYFATPINGHRYAWAADFFDYFNVLSPQESFYPNVDPLGTDPTVGTAAQTPKWPGGTTVTTPADLLPQPVPHAIWSDSAKLKAVAHDETAATQGLVNLNTANAYVIAQVPFTNDADANADIGYAIVHYRENVGPLRSLFDLQRIVVPDVDGYKPKRLGIGSRIADAFARGDDADPGPEQGCVSPYVTDKASNYAAAAGVPATVGVRGDYRGRYLVLNRVSNLVCFRSDCFTAYLLVQGWRDAGTDHPTLAVERRAAMIVDRSGVFPVFGGVASDIAGVTQPAVYNVGQN